MQMNYSIAISLWMLLLAAALYAASESPAPWQVSEAPVRIRFMANSKQEKSLFVPVPEELATKSRVLCAMDDRGMRLDAHPVVLDGKLLGVAVDVASISVPTVRSFVKNPYLQPNCSLYLTEEPPIPPQTDWQTPSVLLNRHVQPLTTRGFTAEEMLWLYNHRTTPSGREEASVGVLWPGDVPEYPPWNVVPSRQHRVAMMQWEAAWLAEKPLCLRFGADQRHVAWTVLLDGTPVANWQDAENMDIKSPNGLLGQAVSVEKGLHVLQFLVVEGKDEPRPRLVVKTAEAPEGEMVPMTWLPAWRPTSMSVEWNRQPGRKIGYSCIPYESYSFVGTSEQLDVAYCRAEAAKHSSLEVLAEAPGSKFFVAVPKGGNPITFRHDDGQTLTWNAPRRWQQSKAVLLRMYVGRMTPLVQDGELLQGEIEAGWPSWVPSFIRRQLKVEITTEQREGGKGMVTEKTVDSDGTIRFALPMDRHTAGISIQPILGGCRPAMPMNIRVRHPEDMDRPLHAQGEALYDGADVDAARVVLVCNPWKRGSLTEQPLIEHVDSIAVMDDFMATAWGPMADEPFETMFSEGLDAYAAKGASVYHLAVRPSMGTAPSWSMLTALSTLSTVRPRIVLLAVGQQAAEAGLSSEAIAAQLSFVSQSCRALGCEPVLVTLPRMRGVSQETARQTAFYVKELGVHEGIPVIDLYEQVLRHKVDTDQWYAMGQSLRLGTLHNGARRWVAFQLARGLSEWIHRPSK